MKDLLKSPWVLCALGSLTFLATTMGLMISVANKLVPRPKTYTLEETTIHPKNFASWNYINPDIDELARQIEEKKTALDQREKALDRMQQQLERERKEWATVTNWVTSIQEEIDQLVTRVTEEEAESMRQIVTVYQKMDPPDAAKMLYELDDERIARIFKFLKQSEVSEIIKVWLKEDDQKLKRVHDILDQYHRTLLPSNQPLALR